MATPPSEDQHSRQTSLPPALVHPRMSHSPPLTESPEHMDSSCVSPMSSSINAADLHQSSRSYSQPPLLPSQLISAKRLSADRFKHQIITSSSFGSASTASSPTSEKMDPYENRYPTSYPYETTPSGQSSEHYRHGRARSSSRSAQRNSGHTVDLMSSYPYNVSYAGHGRRSHSPQAQGRLPAPSVVPSNVYVPVVSGPPATTQYPSYLGFHTTVPMPGTTIPSYSSGYDTPPIDTEEWGFSRGMHSRSADYACEHCEYQAGSQEQLERHMQKHLKLHKCRFEGCSRQEGFATPNDRERHEKSVHKIPGHYWKCMDPQCSSYGKEFSRRDNLKDHLRRMHPMDNLSENDANLMRSRLADEWRFEKSGSYGQVSSSSFSRVEQGSSYPLGTYGYPPRYHTPQPPYHPR